MLDELDTINARLAIYKANIGINALGNYVILHDGSNIPYISHSQVLLEKNLIDSGKISFRYNVNNDSSRLYSSPKAFIVSTGVSIHQQLSYSPEFAYCDRLQTNWDDDKQKLHDYFQKYRETGQNIFLYLIHQIVIKQRQIIQEGFDKLRNSVRYFRKKLLTSFQRLKGSLIKILVWFHIKRFNVNSDDEDSLNFTLSLPCIFTFFHFIKRIDYEYYRKRNHHRKIEFRY